MDPIRLQKTLSIGIAPLLDPPCQVISRVAITVTVNWNIEDCTRVAVSVVAWARKYIREIIAPLHHRTGEAPGMGYVILQPSAQVQNL